jgi:SNF2 family DNA or RNA helicase
VLQVMIFRLITRGTIEERMMQMTKKKMVLEHLVVGRLKAQNINQVNNILLENNALFVWWQTGII